jgi:hypothetical protein
MSSSAAGCASPLGSISSLHQRRQQQHRHWASSHVRWWHWQAAGSHKLNGKDALQALNLVARCHAGLQAGAHRSGLTLRSS